MRLRGLWDELNLLGRALAVAIVALPVAGIAYAGYSLAPVQRIGYASASAASAAAAAAEASTTGSAAPAVPAHIATPDPVRGIYMTACIASERSLRDRVLKTIDGTEINSVVVDLKDYTGTISYAQTSVQGPKGEGCRIDDLPEFIAELHAKGLYAIARVTVFQDPLYSVYDPSIAVQSASRPGHPWTDKKGLAFIDPDHPEYWKYIASIAEEAHSIGFDEVNFDYIRFPSDGDMSDARFAIPAGKTKPEVITEFFRYLRGELAPQGIVMSADLFGQTTVNRDDMGIGQILEDALPYFDYVSPMDYPSHFIDGFMGFANPAEHPYDVIKGTMTSAVERAVAASSTPDKLRPWLQAFDLGAKYTPDMVHAQIEATYQTGVSSWMLWDAANQYDRKEL